MLTSSSEPVSENPCHGPQAHGDLLASLIHPQTSFLCPEPATLDQRHSLFIGPKTSGCDPPGAPVSSHTIPEICGPRCPFSSLLRLISTHLCRPDSQRCSPGLGDYRSTPASFPQLGALGHSPQEKREKEDAEAQGCGQKQLLVNLKAEPPQLHQLTPDIKTLPFTKPLFCTWGVQI